MHVFTVCRSCWPRTTHDGKFLFFFTYIGLEQLLMGSQLIREKREKKMYDTRRDTSRSSGNREIMIMTNAETCTGKREEEVKKKFFFQKGVYENPAVRLYLRDGNCPIYK